MPTVITTILKMVETPSNLLNLVTLCASFLLLSDEFELFCKLRDKKMETNVILEAIYVLFQNRILDAMN